MPSDLKSLCLTSKTFCAVATPCLYNRIRIQTWSETDIERFIRSITAGSCMNLCNTRTLRIEDEEPRKSLITPRRECVDSRTYTQ